MNTAVKVERESTFIEVNGITLHVVQAGDKTGTPVILLHGFPEFWYGWNSQIDGLANAGLRVICPDQRGYNVSSKPKEVEAYRMKHLVADVISLIDRLGYDQVYLAGHDWGGAVAWSVALRHPDRIKKLVIVNSPHPTTFGEELRSNPVQSLRSIYMVFFQLPLIPEALLMMGGGIGAAQMLFLSSVKRGTFNDSDMVEYTKAWNQQGAMTAMLNWYRATVRKPSSAMPLPDQTRVKVPTLIIWGEKDVALGTSLAQPSVEQCDDGRLVFIKDAGHWVIHEKPDQVNALMTEFFT